MNLAQYFRFVRRVTSLREQTLADPDIDRSWIESLIEECRDSFSKIGSLESPFPKFILGRALFGRDVEEASYDRTSPFLLPLESQNGGPDRDITLHTLAICISFFRVSELFQEMLPLRKDILYLTRTLCSISDINLRRDFYVHIVDDDLYSHDKDYFVESSEDMDKGPINDAKELLRQLLLPIEEELKSMSDEEIASAEAVLCNHVFDEAPLRSKLGTMDFGCWRRETLTFALLALINDGFSVRSEQEMYGIVTIPNVLIYDHKEYKWAGIWMIVILRKRATDKRYILDDESIGRLYALTVLSNRIFDRANYHWLLSKSAKSTRLAEVADARASAYWSNIISFSHDGKQIPNFLSELLSSEDLSLDLRLQLAERLASQLEIRTAAYSALIRNPLEGDSNCLLIEQAKVGRERETLHQMFCEVVATQFLPIVVSSAGYWAGMRKSIWPYEQVEVLREFLSSPDVVEFLKNFADGKPDVACAFLSRLGIKIQALNSECYDLFKSLPSTLSSGQTWAAFPRLRTAIRFVSGEILTNFLRHGIPTNLGQGLCVDLSLSVVKELEAVTLEWRLGPAKAIDYDKLRESGRHGLRSLRMIEDSLGCKFRCRYTEIQGEDFPICEGRGDSQIWSLEGIPEEAFMH